jgi:biopolymer transport protein ExbD
MKLERSVRLSPYLLFIVPLMDLVLLFLLLFIVSSTFLVNPGIGISLPSSKFTLGPARNPLIVAITANPIPSIFFRDRQVSLEELGHEFDQDRATDRSIIIRADRMAPQGVVVEVMNLCLDHGYSVALATSPQGS